MSEREVWNKAIEAAIEACKREHLNDPQDDGDDIYDSAINDCIFSLRKLLEPTR